MKHDEQWFEPGDKVIRVDGNQAPPEQRWNYHHPETPTGSYPEYGKVYCVEDFWEGPEFNVVMLVGFGGWRYHKGMKVGWPAKAFRRVDEIKLCVSAVKRTPKTEEVEG